MIHFVLTKNHLDLDDASYHQIHDTAIGTKVASNYTYFVIGKLQHELLATAQLMPLIWSSYIEDIIMISKHGEETLKKV